MKGALLEKKWNELSKERKQQIQERAKNLEQEYLNPQENKPIDPKIS